MSVRAVGLFCLCALTLSHDLVFNEDAIVPEDQVEQGDIHIVPLVRRARSNEAHARLVKWIGDTHTRKIHPIRFVDESVQAQKLVSEVQLKNADLVEYYGEVYVGKQPFKAVYDTGSGIFWVPGEKCVETACKEHHQLKLDESIALEKGRVSIRYGTGHMSGQRVTADVRTAGVLVEKQDFLMSTEEHGQVFAAGLFDGVFGMGRRELAGILSKAGDTEGRADPFYMNAIKQNRLKAPEFSFYVSAHNDKPGAVVFGGTNKKLYKEPITWHKGKSNAYWMMDVQEISLTDNHAQTLLTIDTTDKENEGVASLRGIADTGTSLLVGPASFIQPILEHVNVNNDCSNMKDLKTINIKMGDVTGKSKTYSLEPKDYVMQREGTCKTGIAIMALQLPGTHPIMILGDTFLRRYYSVYNNDRNEIGFALANHQYEDEGIPQLSQQSTE